MQEMLTKKAKKRKKAKAGLSLSIFSMAGIGRAQRHNASESAWEFICFRPLCRLSVTWHPRKMPLCRKKKCPLKFRHRKNKGIRFGYFYRMPFVAIFIAPGHIAGVERGTLRMFSTVVQVTGSSDTNEYELC